MADSAKEKAADLAQATGADPLALLLGVWASRVGVRGSEGMGMVALQD